MVYEMKKSLHILLSALSFDGMSCIPVVEEEIDMYAAPYTEFRPSERVDGESSDAEATANETIEQEGTDGTAIL